MNYKNINLEKGMYNHPNKSFSQILEELDPSENYDKNSSESKLDAFQRQLKRFDIKVHGKCCDVVGKFYENSNSSVLFPEYIARCVEKGMKKNKILKNLIATTNKIDTLQYRGLTITSELQKKSNPEIVEERASIPEISITPNENPIKLNKLAEMITTSYEFIVFQPITTFSKAIEIIGIKFADALVDMAIKVLKEGNNKKNNAEIISTKEKGKICYEDLINGWTKFENFEMNTILANPLMIAEIAKIDELKNPISKLNFPIDGALTTPLGAQIFKTNVAPKSAIILLDNRYALHQIIAKDITSESDKLIDKQIARTTITTISGFELIYTDARIIIETGALDKM